jgi:hypothetical protein
MKEYPTRNGISIPISEIYLPESNLDLEKPENWNNHHRSFTKRIFTKSVLYSTVRYLETQQDMMPIDVHNYLHAIYSSPRLPSPKNAIAEIERAKDAGERLKVRSDNEYIYKAITDEIMKQCIVDYEDFV